MGVDNGESYECDRAVGIWEISEGSSQFCYEPEISFMFKNPKEK